MIQVKALIAGFEQAISEEWGYIYGATHEKWSEAKQAAYAREHSGDPDRENSVKYGGKWAGHWVTDCSGIFHYWFSQIGGKIAHGSNSIWNDALSEKGTLPSGSQKEAGLRPGYAVFTTSGDRHNHIGLYIGNGKVIEAQGAKAGVIYSQITDKRWTAWGRLKNVQYDSDDSGGGREKMTATVVLPTGASGSTVNMRARPNTKSVLLDRVPVGTIVEIVSDQGEWCQIRYNGLTGWMMANYLEYSGQDGESGGDAAEDEETAAKIEMALNEIEMQVDFIRSALERG